MWRSTYPTRSTACRWARLKNLRRLISNLWICHDRWRTEWVGVWICGHVLLKHTQTHYLTTTLHVSQQSAKVRSKTNRGRVQTHKVSVHLLHPASHVDHHVIEHAEGVPHVLSKHEKKRPARGQTGWMAGIMHHMFTRNCQLVNNSIICTNMRVQITMC